MEKVAALYARVSSDQQKENHTIQSQTAALTEYAKAHGYAVPSQWQFQDEGYSGATLLRPGLEAVRDLAAAGQIAAVLIYSPDRLSRKYAYRSCWRKSSLVAESNWSSYKRPLQPPPKISCWFNFKV